MHPAKACLVLYHCRKKPKTPMISAMNPFKSNSNFSLILLFATTLFFSASLMFLLQPLFGKILLPLLGGSPAVWNTCMVFYQSILFLGYLYAHYVSTKLQPRLQIQLHVAIILISFLALPLALPENNAPPTLDNPTFWLLSTLFLAIGMPFFVVSTTAPLMQKWFSTLGHQSSNDPYFLYAASNAGSLLALLSYPFIVEPSIGLEHQKIYWSVGYVVLALLIAGCAFRVWNSPSEPTLKVPDTQAISTAPDIYQKLHWLALAFVPSSLLLGLTNFISTDIASAPLLWIIPLTLYLLSFIIVFSTWNDKTHLIMVRLQAYFLLPFLIYAFINPADLPYWGYLVLHLLAFFFAVMVCHGELARSRPSTEHLTTYYLIMSFAGMLGGMFNAFVAPFIFNGIYEYPLMIIAALMLRPATTISIPNVFKQLLGPALLVVIGLVIYANVDNLLDYFDTIAISLIVLTCVAFVLRARPIAYSGLTGAIIFLSLGMHGLSTHTLYQERSFFGVLAVRESTLINEQNQPEKYHELFHGTTKHGAQRLTTAEIKTPLTYYSRPGPMGQLFKEFDSQDQHWTIGVVGLGAGALSCYAKDQQQWTLYEIDPLVVDIARNPLYFSYLSQCNEQAVMKVGDARLSLANEPDGKFDLIVMDAFSSDSVPTHLLTEEALALYFKKLKPEGMIAFHITNRHLLLKKVLSIHAEHMKVAALLQEFKPQREMPLVVATDWVVMAKNPKTLEPLAISRLGSWQKMPLYFDMPPWTDDFTNIISIWK